MKKSLLSIIFLMATIFVMAQTAPREMVVVEVGTGTWCTYCPGAAMGVDDLLANGKKVAVVENHNGDSYANNFSNARNTLYAISGFPTATFDGNQAVVGGSHTASMYNNYLPKYNSAIAVTSPVEMTMTETHSGLDYTITCVVTKVGTITATNIKLNFAVTQSKITQNWQGQTHLEHVNRLMVPDQNGTAIDFTSGDVQTVVLTFSMLPAWPLEDCEFVAWLQNMDAGQGTIAGSGSPAVKKWTTFQGLKRGVIDLLPDFTVASTNVSTGVPVTFTNATTGGYIGVPETYEWIFEGGNPSTSTEKDPIVTYDNCGTYDVTLIVDRGSQIDTLTRTAYMQVGPVVNVVANPGLIACWYQTITLDATTPGAISYLWTPGGATTPTIDVTYAQYGIGAHDFTVKVNMGACETTKAVSTYLDACTGVGEKSKDVTVSVFPNPSNGEFTLEMNSAKNLVADMSITNNLGMTVYTEKGVAIDGKTTKKLNLSGLSSGIYLLSLQNGDMKISQKILIK
ncbi:MAG: T9SS type A sorting domain-containing protein [Bacteroidales bacterium]